MRLRLRLTDTPELADLPWEFLYDPRLNRFLAQSRRTPLVRYLDLPDPPQPLSVDGPLRLLVMISSPSDCPPLDVEQEWSLLTDALAQPQAQGRVIVERLTANMSDCERGCAAKNSTFSISSVMVFTGPIGATACLSWRTATGGRMR